MKGHNSRRVFQVASGLRPGRSLFDLSYEIKLTCGMGQLIPIMCDECVPGDLWKIGNQALIRFQPMVAPIMHEINFFVHYFFVPYRLLWTSWEDFITGGVNGDDASVLPRWDPTGPPLENAAGSLWDYLGFPVDVVPTGAFPIDFPRRAYNKIFNEYYRDETLVAERAETAYTIARRAWEKDYFTSALPWQQRGTAPALPVTMQGSAEWDTAPGLLWPAASEASPNNMIVNGGNFQPYNAVTKAGLEEGYVDLTMINDNEITGNIATFDIADLRLAVQIQKWMERNARAGARYTEFLKAHFDVSPRDERLQRPEYIGGTKSPVVISEVLQTSQSDTTPQGNLAGHGLSISNGFAGSYRVQEYGLIMGIMSIMPKPAYTQGIDRQWLRRTRYDFYFPEFANLSEQMVERAEIYCTAVENENRAMFGYQGAYDELRTKQSKVVAEFRSTFDYWHLARQFGSAPQLNESFIECVPRNDIFAVPTDPGLMVQFGNILTAVRPLPAIANPGLIDHN